MAKPQVVQQPATQSVQILDQMVLSRLFQKEISDEAIEYVSLFTPLVEDGTLPSGFEVTRAGLMEFLGFRFDPRPVIERVCAPLMSGWTTSQVLSHVTFLLRMQKVKPFHRKNGEERLSMPEFTGVVPTRISEKMKFVSHQQALLGQMARDHASLASLSEDRYWAARVILSDLFVDRFDISSHKAVYNWGFELFLSKGLPLVRHALHHLRSKGRVAVGFEATEEWNDDEAVSRLVHGSLTSNERKRVVFITEEDHWERIKTYLTAARALHQHIRPVEALRITHPGLIIKVSFDDISDPGVYDVGEYFKRCFATNPTKKQRRRQRR